MKLSKLVKLAKKEGYTYLTVNKNLSVTFYRANREPTMLDGFWVGHNDEVYSTILYTGSKDWKDTLTEIKYVNSSNHIVCAAVKFKNGEIIASARHFDKLMNSQMRILDIDKSMPTEGFIDKFGQFHNREESLKIVKNSGQPLNLERNDSETWLYSEGLY